MADYDRPKKSLHREFLYLNFDTIVNSLSALEAGKIDEILQKAHEAREGGLGAGLKTGVLDASASKKKTSEIEEEMVRTRTVFSAFDSWHQYLKEGGGLGTINHWGQNAFDSLVVGDTLTFQGRLRKPGASCLPDILQLCRTCKYAWFGVCAKRSRTAEHESDGGSDAVDDRSVQE